MSDTKICLGCGARDECDCTEPSVHVELLADLAHRLWWHWSEHIALEEDISDDRLERWRGLWVEYDELTDAEKNTDRELVEEQLRNKRHPEDKWE